MALTDTKDLPARRPLFRPLFRLPARLQAWLAGEHAATQRMAGTAFIIRVGGAAIIFLSQVLLARWLGDDEFGVYVYAWTWVLLVGDIIHLGLPITAQRYVPEYTQRGEFDRLRGFVAASRWMVLASGVAVAAFAAALVHGLKSWLEWDTIVPLYLACIALPLYTLSNMLDGLARCYNAANIALLPPYVLRPITLIAVMALAHVTGFATDATTAMAAFTFAVWLATLFQLLMLERRLRATVPPGPKTYDLATWLSTSIPVLAVWAFFTLLTYTDVLVLRHFRPPDEVAHYFAAAKTLSLVAFINFSVAAAVAHRIASYHVAGDRAALAAFASTTVRWTFWPSLLATAFILALGKPILWLFGPDFVEAYPLMFILAIGLVARAAVGPAERMLNVMGEQRICALVYAIAFVVNLSFALVLVSRIGGAGAAVALVSAVLCESALLFVVAKRRLGLHLFIFGASGPR
jgi:O-antigen/teichoic acid export membrane protein